MVSGSFSVTFKWYVFVWYLHSIYEVVLMNNMSTDMNLMQLAVDKVSSEFKKVLTDQVLEEVMKDFEVQMREQVEKQVDKLSIEDFTVNNNIMTMRNDLVLFVKWKDEGTPLDNK